MITHRPVAFPTNGTKIVNIERTAFALWCVVSHLKHEWRHDVFAPCHETLVLKVLVATIKKPNLFAQRTWYRLLHYLFTMSVIFKGQTTRRAHRYVYDPSLRRTTCPPDHIASCRVGQPWRSRGGPIHCLLPRPSGRTSCQRGCSESTPCTEQTSTFYFYTLGGSKPSIWSMQVPKPSLIDISISKIFYKVNFVPVDPCFSSKK